jgi:hypothetical protein
MGDLISWLAHNPIVRVTFVPISMALAIYFMWRLAAPPPWEDDANHT